MLIIGGLVVGLAACSTLRLSYNQGPTLAYWWADRYVDFDDGQSAKVRQVLADWFRWHRATQLADLGAVVARARADAAGTLSPAQVCRFADDLSQRALRAYEHAVPAIAEIAPTLRPEQIRNIERRQAKNNRGYVDDHLQPDPELRQREAVKRMIKRAEDYYGSLDDNQRALVARRTAASPFDAQVSLAERRARQQDTLASLRRWSADKPPPETVRAELLQLGQRVRQSPREPYRAYQQRLLEHNCAFIAELHNSTNAEQRQHLIRKLGSWEADIRTLVADLEG
ncbi:DUF6279 family lipoprotein [Piscinibacter sakaiensis]|uniref:DUF6279 family lipoprotein n=1 Tax=Piscinibacter sakaiensis TaxID=1547922 RepID=UPI003AB0766C